VRIRLEYDMSLDVRKSKMMTYRYLRERGNLKKQREPKCENIRLTGVTGITVALEWKAAPPASWLGGISQLMISRKDRK